MAEGKNTLIGILVTGALIAGGAYLIKNNKLPLPNPDYDPATSNHTQATSSPLDNNDSRSVISQALRQQYQNEGIILCEDGKLLKYAEISTNGHRTGRMFVSGTNMDVLARHNEIQAAKAAKTPQLKKEEPKPADIKPNKK